MYNIQSTLPSKYRYTYNTVKQYSYSNEVPTLNDFLKIMSRHYKMIKITIN